MKVKDIFDRTTAIAFIEEYCKDKPATRRASSRLAACDTDLVPVGDGDMVLVTVGAQRLGLPKAQLDELLYFEPKPE